jgi:hypothetical protein
MCDVQIVMYSECFPPVPSVWRECPLLHVQSRGGEWTKSSTMDTTGGPPRLPASGGEGGGRRWGLFFLGDWQAAAVATSGQLEVVPKFPVPPGRQASAGGRGGAKGRVP